MAGCGGSCGSGSCGGGGGNGGGSHACACEEKPLRIGEELPPLPYETLYVRCMCGAHGFTAETWKEIGAVVLTSGGKHWHPKALQPCTPYPQLTGDDSLISERLWNLEKKP